ncbi:MAG: type II secretion system F family protein [Erysipelotrichaceae bacterium]
MPVYQYKAMDEFGVKTKGAEDVIDEQELITLLNSKKLYLISCSKQLFPQTSIRRQKVKLKDIIIFSRQFSVMIQAGITINESIKMIAGYTTNPELARILNEIDVDMARGIPLSESMAKYPTVFKSFFISMIHVGEFSGEFDMVLRRTADFYEKEGKLRKKIQAALMYPCILVAMTIAIIVYLLSGIVPTFAGLFRDMGIKLPPITSFLITVSDFFKNYGIFLALGIVFVIILIVKYFKTEKGKYQFDKGIMGLPVIGNVVSMTTTSRFTRSMNILLQSGITLIQSFEITDSLMSNVYILERIQTCRDRVRLGYSYAESLNEMRVFPAIMINMVRVGEKTGSLPDVFAKTSDFFDDEADAAIEKMISLLEPIILVVIAVVICLIFLSLMLPMFDLLDNVK